MAEVHRNPFDLLSDEGDVQPTTKKTQKSQQPTQRKPVVFPGDKSKKKTSSPLPGSKGPSKDFIKPSETKNKPSSSVAVPTAPTGQLTLSDVRELRSKANAFVSGLDDVLGGHTALFKFVLSASSNDYYNKMLREKPYKALEEIVRSDKFMEGLLGALRVKHAGVYDKSTDLRNKPLSVRVDKKLSKGEFVEKLVSLFGWQGRKKQRSATDASRAVYDLLEPVFAVKAEDNKYISYLEEKLASEVGSQGNIKSGGSTLADFIVTAPKKQNKKKKGKAAAAEPVEEKKPAVEEKKPATATKEEAAEEPEYDPIYNAETIAKSIPFGWQFGLLTKAFLRKKGGEGETNDQGGKEWYFYGANEEIDNAFVFWNNTDVVFLFTTGSE
jgi:predicted house-cleaning noncanonical NTP pyrophosphatase (MazG superfamily)